MCQLPSNPLHTIIEVSELFQAFLKHASIDGFVESWCLEIRLRSSAGAIPTELPVDCMHHLIALHSLNYFILKRLDERHHELTMECCSCGWQVSHIPEFQHSEINRYTPGTVIRWSQGECHVLLAPSIRYEESLSQGLQAEPCSDPEEMPKEDPVEKILEGITPQQVVREEELPPRSGVIQSTEQRAPCSGREPELTSSSPQGDEAREGSNEENLQDKDVAQDSQYFIKHQHFCEEDADCAAQRPQELNTVNEHDIKEGKESRVASPLWLRQGMCGEGPSPEDTFANGASEDDEESSRMLIINEDDNSQDAGAPPDTTAPHALSFHRALPLATDNVRTLPLTEKRSLPDPSPRKEEDDEEEEEDSREDENDDDDEDSSSVSSSSSSSSTSSSSSSSDDDDRINFKKRVEQAAQAAREAAASAAATTASSFQESAPFPSSLPFQEGIPHSNDPLKAFAYPRSKGGVMEERQDAAAFAAYRHPDDIQAAQGLAALGKGHEFPLEGVPIPAIEIGRAPPKTTTTSKIAQKLLQNKSANVRRVGQKSCFQCGVCGKIFPRFYKALEHQVSHSGEKPWECDSCDKRFTKYHSMQKHQRAKHTPAHLQEFKCYICEKNFGLQSALQMHLATHATLKPFSCSVCGQTFALKFTKEAHEAQHTGNRPWGCSVCPKTFITKYKLRAHMKAHTGELFCTICNRTFTSQDAFTRHKKRHETQKETLSSVSTDPKQNSHKRRTNSVSKGRGRAALKDTSFGSSAAPSLSSEFRCQMCNKTFAKSTDLTPHLASCNAITYCPPSNIHPGISGSSLLQEGSTSQTLNIHPPPDPQPDPHHLHHQPLSSATPLTACMLVEEKKLSQFTPCATPSDVAENMEGLDRQPYLMNTLPVQNMTSVTPYQLQEMVIHTSSNSVPESLPDYLSEVAFGTVTGNASTIIFQPANGHG